MQIVYARLLSPGDYFIPDERIEEWDTDPLGWRVKTHTLTERGDYSTFVEINGCTWSERFDPEDRVWITKYHEEQGENT